MNPEPTNNQAAEDEEKIVHLIEAIITERMVRFVIEDSGKIVSAVPQEIEEKKYLVFLDENGKEERVLISSVKELEIL